MNGLIVDIDIKFIKQINRIYQYSLLYYFLLLYSRKYDLCAGFKNYVYSQKIKVIRNGKGFRVLKDPGLVKDTILGGHDSCLGDSGGPLWMVLGSTKPTAFIIGVVSRGLNCASSKAPGIYTRIKKYIPWIYRVCF